MKEKLLIRLFNEADAEAVQDIIHRGLREINGKDYPPELIEEYCAYFTLEKIKSAIMKLQKGKTNKTLPLLKKLKGG